MQNFTLIHKQIWIRLFFNFLRFFFHKIWLFCPKISNLGHIKPNTIANIFCRVIEYPCANTYTIRSSNVNTMNMFSNFSRFLYRIWLFCPKIENFRPIQLGIIDDVFSKFMNHHCLKINTNAYINGSMTNIFQFLAIFAKKKKWLFCPKMYNVEHF